MWPPTGLIPWFSKTEGNTYATLPHHPFLFKGKPTQCSRGSTVIRADPRILEEHLAVEATVDASRADAATRLAALNDSSWRFLDATLGVFDEDYEVFSQRARAYLISRASRLVPEAAQATQHYNEGTHDAKASPSSMSKEPIVIDISDSE